MALVSLSKVGGSVRDIVVRDAYHIKDVLKALGGRWVPGEHAWKLPPSACVLEELMRRVPSVILSDDASAWLQDALEHRKHLEMLHTADDAVVKNPRGLDPYQRVGVRFLADAGRAILADDVGLGKTCTSIRAALEVEANPVLIVTRKSLLHNWAVEVARWAGTQAFLLDTKRVLPSPIPRFVVTNYEVVVRRQEELGRVRWEALVVDEASAIKNRKAQRTKAVQALSRNVPYVWLLTATPAPNSPDELWSLLHTIRPREYSSYWRFVEKHCTTAHNFFGGVDILGVKDPDALARELAPVMLRRDKELLNLPPVTHEAVWLSMEGEQKRIYDSIRRDFMAVIDEERSVSAPSVLAQITRLRQVSCTPALVGGPDESAKTDALVGLLEELTPKHKILVFTTFAAYVDNLLTKLKRYGAVAVTGSVSAEQRVDVVRRFAEDDSCRVFLGTIGAAGEGLNLQAADVVIFANKSWVPSENEIQAVGRAHRRGQKNPVHVITLAYNKSIDQYIEEALNTKKTATEAVNHIAARLKREVTKQCW